MRQIGPLFGVSHSAAHRVIDTLRPLVALAPVSEDGREGEDPRHHRQAPVPCCSGAAMLSAIP
jgi:hypothetical protein